MHESQRSEPTPGDEARAVQGAATAGRHPIHPMLIPFPIGFFVGSLVCDIIANVSDAQAGFWFSMATWLIMFGIISALLAGVFGFVDYLTARMSQAGKRNATIHMVVNLAVVVLYIINYYVRIQDPPLTTTGYVLSVIGVLSLLYSGWLGGEMVYVNRVGVTPITELRDRGEESPPSQQRRAA